MENKSNRLLIGIIILLLGIFSLLQNAFRINYTYITVTVVGMAFLLLYRTKRKSWSLVIGAYLAYIGAAGLIKMLPVVNSSGGIAGAMFFIVPGIIFLILFFDKNKKGLLYPGSLLVWFGLFVMIAMSGAFANKMMGGMFFICVGMAFVTIFILGKYFIGKLPLYLGLALALFGCFLSGGIFHFNIFNIFSSMFNLGPIALIIVSLVVIASAFKKK